MYTGSWHLIIGCKSSDSTSLILKALSKYSIVSIKVIYFNEYFCYFWSKISKRASIGYSTDVIPSNSCICLFNLAVWPYNFSIYASNWFTLTLSESVKSNIIKINFLRMLSLHLIENSKNDSVGFISWNIFTT